MQLATRTSPCKLCSCHAIEQVVPCTSVNSVQVCNTAYCKQCKNKTLNNVEKLHRVVIVILSMRERVVVVIIIITMVRSSVTQYKPLTVINSKRASLSNAKQLTCVPNHRPRRKFSVQSVFTYTR